MGDVAVPARVDEPGDERSTARRARLVTYGAVGALLAAALVQVDVWPLTAMRLFSNVRTDHGASTSLVAVGLDGSRTDLRPAGGAILATTSHLFDDLERADDARAREMVHAWLDLAGVDPAGVDRVVLEKATWVMAPDTGARHETGREVVAEVRP
ncbi:hypothetical protein GCM10009809_25730 [Isoptericola hypogeus]|uniref:Uncharacterized protein n=1 Tax=Isoptericola hypogeus TaxID=300179 RepID=A0ABN2JJ42_9MICO